MPKVTMITISAEERTALEKAAKYGAMSLFRLRCQATLLKTESRTSLAIARQLGYCEMSVNDWLYRYRQPSLPGLKVQKGRGRKAALQADTNLAAVRQAVQNNRQRLLLAKAELEQNLGKQFGMLALKRFLKKREVLAEFEALSQQGHTDVLCGDESRVSMLPCVSYGWQFADEQVTMPSERGGGVRLDVLSLSVCRLTVVVLDNARVHRKVVKERGRLWQECGLFVWFLPTYSPHLTLVKP